VLLLSKRGVVDLIYFFGVAARNVLLTSELVCKVSGNEWVMIYCYYYYYYYYCLLLFVVVES